jgi:23S rRNA (uracil1939-C5)-methyltransferase
MPNPAGGMKSHQTIGNRNKMARSRTRKKVLSQEPVKVTIESLCHVVRGVAHVNGKVVFIDDALPGE